MRITQTTLRAVAGLPGPKGDMGDVTPAATAAKTAAETAASQVTAALAGLSAREYYLDSTVADDSGDGTYETPKKTFSAALALLQAGDVLFVRRGGRYRINAVSTLPNNAHILPYGGGERPVFDFSVALPNASFSAVSGQPNVYQISVNTASLGIPSFSDIYNYSYFQVWEGAPGSDTKLTNADGHIAARAWTADNTNAAGRLAYVQSNAGSFHVLTSGAADVTQGSSGSTFTLYLHAPGDGNPSSNGKEYSLGMPGYQAFRAYFANSISDIWFTRGSNAFWLNAGWATFTRCRFDGYPLDGPVGSSSTWLDCESYGISASVGGRGLVLEHNSDLGGSAGSSLLLRPRVESAGTGLYGTQPSVRIEEPRFKSVTTPISITGTVTTRYGDWYSDDSAPGSSIAVGTPGEIRLSSGFLYVCTAANTWRRVAVSSF